MSRVGPARLGTTLVLGLAASQVACTLGARQIAHGGVQGGLEGTLAALDEPRNQVLLRRLLQDPDIQRAARDLTAAITGGALDGVSEPERVRRLGEASDTYIRTVSAVVGEVLSEDLSPAVTASVEDLVAGAVNAALRPENRRHARSFVDGVTRTMLTAFTQSTARGLRDDLGPALGLVVADELGPALEQVVENNLGPAVRRVLEREFHPAVQDAFGGEDGGAAGRFARVLTKQIVLGTNDGMSELGMSPSPNKKDGLGMMGWLPIGLGALLLLLSLLLVRLLLNGRALARERARSEELLLGILHALQADGFDPNRAPDAAALLARVRQHAAERVATDGYLAQILARAQLPSHPASAPSRRDDDTPASVGSAQQQPGPAR